jgi:adenylate cyclase
MNPRWQVRVYEKHRLLHSADCTGILELGRQSDPDEGMYVPRPSGDRSRMVIARLDEQSVSRRHVLVTPLPGGKVRIDNLSATLAVFLAGSSELKPGMSVETALPLVLSVEPKVVRIEEAEEKDEESGLLRSLREAPMPPQATILASRFPSLELENKGQVDSAKILGWLQATMGVFLSAASSSDFFAKAARAVVDVVGLDSGQVILLENGEWRTQAGYTSGRIKSESWQASRSVLGRVVAEKRTFWEIPPATVSLKEIKAVVAAPILDSNGEVVSVLYGDQRLGSGAHGPAMITDLQARLVELLASGVAAGLARLKQEKAALKARVQFEQFFTPELAHQLAIQPDLLEGRDCEVTLLFCDIRGFSRICERLGPGRTVAWIGDVMDMFSQCVLDHAGVLVDYIGDELIAMWGAPAKEPHHARLACRAALAMLATLPELNKRWQVELGEPMAVGIGVNTGVARVGNMGSRSKFKYGPLGHTVNLASRVQGATKYLKCELLITGATRAGLDESFALRRVCTVRVVNIALPVDLYELATSDTPDWPQAKQEYEKALEAFGQKNFRMSARILGNWMLIRPDDGPSLLLLGRAVNCLIDEPVNFDPVWVLPGK